MRRIRARTFTHRAGERSPQGQAASRRAARGLDRSARPRMPEPGRDEETADFNRTRKLVFLKLGAETIH